MAEQIEFKKREKVLGLITQDGGIFMGTLGHKTTLPGTLQGIDMELDRSLGGVVVRFECKQGEKLVKKRKLVPVSHCREIDLEVN